MLLYKKVKRPCAFVCIVNLALVSIWQIKLSACFLLSMEPWATTRKTSSWWRYHQLLSIFLAKGHLPASVALVTSANYNGGNVMIPGAVYRHFRITLRLKKTPEKTSAWRPSDDCCATSPRLKWISYPQLRSTDCTARQEGRRKEKRKWQGWEIFKLSGIL